MGIVINNKDLRRIADALDELVKIKKEEESRNHEEKEGATSSEPSAEVTLPSGGLKHFVPNEHYKRWTDEDDLLAAELYRREMSLSNIARMMGRTQSAVSCRLSKKGITRASQ
jgi:hypothetical protein